MEGGREGGREGKRIFRMRRGLSKRKRIKMGQRERKKEGGI